MSPPAVFSLPLELLEEITEIVPLDEQLALCRVSKLFHSFTTRCIYRVVSLDSPSIVIACCRTLVANTIAASSMRQLSITYTPAEPTKTQYFSTFYSTISKALSCLSQLQELRLMVYDPNYIHTLPSTHFPQLRRFECYLTLTQPLASFLNHHPTITYLQIAPHEALGPYSLHPAWSSHPPTTASEPQRLHVHLPALQYFTGNAECISLLSPAGASLRAAFLLWDAVDATPQDAIRALERSSGATLNVVSCRRRGWNLDLFELISAWLPDLYVLSVTNLLVVDSKPTEAYLNTIRTLLPRFSTLRKLHLHCVDTWKMADIKSNLDDDYSTVNMWSGACPSLVECILPHSNNLKWIRIQIPLSSSHVWIPDPNDSNNAGVEWTWKTLTSFPKRTQQDTRWECFAEVVRERVGKSVGVARGRSSSLYVGKVHRREMQLRYEATVDVLRELSWGEGDDS